MEECNITPVTPSRLAEHLYVVRPARKLDYVYTIGNVLNCE